MRVGYAIQNGAPDLSAVSGPQLHVRAVIGGLQKLGHTVRTVAIQQGKLLWSDDLINWSIPPENGPSHARWFRFIESSLRRTQYELQLPFVGMFDSYRYAAACTDLLSHCDVLYERHGYMGYGGVIAAKRLGIPLIIELNGNILKEIDVRGLEMSGIQRKIGQWITIRTLLAASHVVVVSEALKRVLTSDFRIPEKRISVVLNGVDVEVFTQSYDENQVRAQYGLGRRRAVAFVGSFEPWHGVELLLSSFKQVQSSHPETQLVLIGEGVRQGAVGKQITEMRLTEHVKLLGRLPQKEVAAVLSVSDVVVAPYPFEHFDVVGTPLKLMEYMAAGKAIVASTAPIHEAITNGVTGLRVSPASSEALALGILRVLEDEELRARLGGNARREGREFAWERTAERLSGLFDNFVPKQNKYSAPAA